MSISTMTEKTYTVKEVAEFFRVTPKTVWRMIYAEELAAFKVGAEYRITQSALDACVQKRPKKRQK